MAFAQPRAFDLTDKLNEMVDTFHLTGSNFFIGSGRDIDYFVQNRVGLQLELERIGFYYISNSKYGDSNCVTVMRAYDEYQRQIDIQIVVDASLKQRVQEKLKEVGYKHPTMEEWNLAFALLK